MHLEGFLMFHSVLRRRTRWVVPVVFVLGLVPITASAGTSSVGMRKAVTVSPPAHVFNTLPHWPWVPHYPVHPGTAISLPFGPTCTAGYSILGRQLYTAG